MRNSVRIEIRGTDPRRFLNDCVREEIDVWDISYVDSNCLRITLPAADLRASRPLLRKCACTVRIIKRTGSRYDIRAALKRPVFVIMAAVFIALCVLINSMVLSFDFTGYETVTPRRLMEAMEKNGLRVGAWKKDIDASDLRNYMISDIPELIWFTVTFSGSHAHVDVRERKKVPQMIDNSVICDVVSDVHGMIQDVSVYSGSAQVKKGDIVAPGNLLVSGNAKLKLDESLIPVHARADILADVWYKTTLVYPSSFPFKISTGRKKTRWALVFGKNRVNLYKNDGKVFDKYDKIIKRYAFSAASFTLPLCLVRESMEEYEIFTPDSHETAEFDARNLVEAAKRRTLSLDAGVRVTEAAARQDSEAVYVYAYGICRRYIGQSIERQQ